MAKDLNVAATAPRPILLGRHLIEWGMKPGKSLGPILRAAFEAQLDGEFHDLESARRWFETRPAIKA